MRTVFNLLLVLLFSLTGCMSCQQDQELELIFDLNHGIGYGPLTMFFPKNVGHLEKAFLINAAATQLEEFESDWGSRTLPVEIFFHDRAWIPCGDREGKFWGCHYGIHGPIHVVMGEYYTASVLYHELVHHNHPNYNDNEHEDELWETFWKPKQRQLWQHIRKKHKDILDRQ